MRLFRYALFSAIVFVFASDIDQTLLSRVITDSKQEIVRQFQDLTKIPLYTRPNHWQ
ncbi:hypothetical protein [Thaumasiovibrio subtropicus]|uniref:hypothetical protein n=1 Tax=Thaumasiovibrio subtropicus TaxID=1891207 RepID=UPI00131B46E9|nr:hypothetical protein [Thaumasiovibrio subtropicus]